VLQTLQEEQRLEQQKQGFQHQCGELLTDEQKDEEILLAVRRGKKEAKKIKKAEKLIKKIEMAKQPDLKVRSSSSRLFAPSRTISPLTPCPPPPGP
jgi:hypothetical protein